MCRHYQHADHADGVRLGPSRFALAGVRVLERVSYADLLRRASDPDTVTLRFESPTVFRSRGTSHPFPIPGLVFGHYRRRWRAFSPVDIDLDLSTLGLGIAYLEGRTDVVTDTLRHGGRTVRRDYVGFVGTVVVSAAAAPPGQRRALHALAALAPYTGTGANTTMGMGVTSYLTPRAASSAATG